MMCPRAATLAAIAVAALMCLSAIGAIGPGVVGASTLAQADQGEQPAVSNVSFSGEGYIATQHDIVQDHPGPEFIWRTGRINLTVTINSGDLSGQFGVCTRAYTHEGDRVNVSDCASTELQPQSEGRVTLSLGDWPEGATGNHTLLLELTAAEYDPEDPLFQSTGSVYVLERRGDLTGDGLSNEQEVHHGTDFTVPDTSGNGLTDWEEVKKWGTDPLVLDTTGDGVDDATLVRLGLNPTEPYAAHKYGLVLALFFVTSVTGVVVGIHRLYTGEPVIGALVAAPPVGAGAANVHNGDDARLETVPDESILTREEYVCELLERNNERMRQRQIVEITGWSKAKVSRVLSELEDEGQIRKIQVGRENVIELSNDGTSQGARV